MSCRTSWKTNLNISKILNVQVYNQKPELSSSFPIIIYLLEAANSAHLRPV